MTARGALPVLVFDLDGTLSDPFDGIWRSANHALEALGQDPVPRQAFRRFIGPPIDQTFATLVPEADEAAIHALVHAFRDRYGRLGYAENTLYPGIHALLQALTRGGFTCGVCTAKRVDFAGKVLALFDLTGYFTFVEGGDVGIRKTHQLRGLHERGQIGRDAIMIGDRASDLAAASANGLRAIGVTWGFGDQAELEGASPWALAASPGDLLRLLTDHPGTPADRAKGAAS